MFLITKWKASRKQKQEQARETRATERQKILNGFDDALKEAERIEDPIDKVTRLKSVEQDITGEISRTNAGISKKAENKGLWAMAATGLGGIAVAVAVVAGAIALAPIAPVVIIGFEALAFGSAFGGLLGCPFVSQKVSASTYKRLTQDAQSFYDNLNEKKKASATLADQTVEDNAQVIARHPEQEREKFLALPGIKDKFTSVVTNKYVAAEDKLAANDDTDKGVASKAAAANSKPVL